MTCDAYLSFLSTAPIGEPLLAPMAEHVSACPDCERVTRLLVEREHALKAAYERLDSGSPPLLTAEAALTTARRRWLARLIGLGLGILFLAILATFARQLVPPGARPGALGGGLSAETFRLHCLTPVQAGELIQPYLRANGSAYYTSERTAGIITVRSTEEEMMKTRSVLDRYDTPGGGVCAVSSPAPTVAP